ncbi:MAG: hypothetical protein U5K77_02845 [Candidatus Saccharibacteria bacterium]|nr:hypothetical protein [Candidatus Saccharibacteria bacterium]
MISQTNKTTANQNGGIILLGLLGLLVFMSIVGLSLLSFSATHANIANRKVYSANAVLVAEAGIENSVNELNQNDSFTGYSTEQTFFNSQSQGRGTFVTNVTDAVDTNTKIITSTGEVYRYNDTSEPMSRARIEVTVVGTGSEGYSVHTGPGGLVLSGSGSITNSDVYVNGTIDLSGAARIGTESQPLNVNVAHYACPAGTLPGPSYPELCTSGEPISLSMSTYIYGSVCATNQVSTGPRSGGNILPGDGGDGLIAGCTAPSVSPPTYNRQNHIDSMTTTANASDIDYNCSQWQSPNGFERTWPANLQLNGNVNADNSCDLTISGDVYITGDLDVGGAAKITASESVGTERPVVVVDGDINMGGGAELIANSQGTGIHFISYRTNASCNPDCTDLSGNELKSSQTLETVRVGGSVKLPGMVMHSYWGTVRLRGSGNVGAAAGQRVDMSGAGTVTFGTQLSSGESTWTITSYKRVFDFD